jgi:hydroxylamine reductase (hybrid-cluster protein)
MEIGQMNFKVMSILDAGETTKYGHRRRLRSTSKPPKASAS